jgi:RNA polymerase sigma-B factor
MATLATRRPPSAHHDRTLLDRHELERNEATREALVERYLPLAQHLARRYPGGGDEEDLMQVASLGLLKAVDRYDASRGIAFSSFAVPTILGELKRYFRDHGWSVRPPRDLQELSGQLASATDTLTAQLRRGPTPQELAERMRRFRRTGPRGACRRDGTPPGPVGSSPRRRGRIGAGRRSG